MKRIRPLPPVAPRRPTRIRIPVEVPRHIQHNIETHEKAKWYLGASSTATEFRFMHPCRNEDVVYTVADGWTYADAVSFHNHLMGWNVASVE